MSVSIVLNGKKEDVNGGMSVLELLNVKGIKPEVVTVEHNDIILEKARYKDIFLKEKDRVEFVYYMGGGHAV